MSRKISKLVLCFQNSVKCEFDKYFFKIENGSAHYIWNLILWKKSSEMPLNLFQILLKYVLFWTRFIDCSKGAETCSNNLLVLVLKYNSNWHAYSFRTKQNIYYDIYMHKGKLLESQRFVYKRKLCLYLKFNPFSLVGQTYEKYP